MCILICLSCMAYTAISRMIITPIHGWKSYYHFWYDYQWYDIHTFNSWYAQCKKWNHTYFGMKFIHKYSNTELQKKELHTLCTWYYSLHCCTTLCQTENPTYIWTQLPTLWWWSYTYTLLLHLCTYYMLSQAHLEGLWCCSGLVPYQYHLDTQYNTSNKESTIFWKLLHFHKMYSIAPTSIR